MSFWPPAEDEPAFARSPSAEPELSPSPSADESKSHSSESQSPHYAQAQALDRDSVEQLITGLKAEYAFLMSQKSQMQSDWEKTTVRQRRRRKIVDFYDQYHFHYVLPDDDDAAVDIAQLEESIDLLDIEPDYRSVIRLIQSEEQSRIEAEEAQSVPVSDSDGVLMRRHPKPKHQSSMTVLTVPSAATLNSQIFAAKAKRQSQTHGGFGRVRSKSAAHVMHSNILYQVSAEEQRVEKQWMRQLRKRRFKIVVAKHRQQRLRRMKKDAESRRTELDQQIAMKERMDELNELRARLQRLEEDKHEFIQSAADQLDLLRTVVALLTRAES